MPHGVQVSSARSLVTACWTSRHPVCKVSKVRMLSPGGEGAMVIKEPVAPHLPPAHNYKHCSCGGQSIRMCGIILGMRVEDMEEISRTPIR